MYITKYLVMLNILLHISFKSLCDKLDPRIYNTTPAWKFLKEKYGIPDANLSFILHQFLYLLMDAFIVQPPDDDD